MRIINDKYFSPNNNNELIIVDIKLCAGSSNL